MMIRKEYDLTDLIIARIDYDAVEILQTEMALRIHEDGYTSLFVLSEDNVKLKKLWNGNLDE